MKNLVKFFNFLWYATDYLDALHFVSLENASKILLELIVHATVVILGCFMRTEFFQISNLKLHNSVSFIAIESFSWFYLISCLWYKPMILTRYRLKSSLPLQRHWRMKLRQFPGSCLCSYSLSIFFTSLNILVYSNSQGYRFLNFQ